MAVPVVVTAFSQVNKLHRVMAEVGAKHHSTERIHVEGLRIAPPEEQGMPAVVYFCNIRLVDHRNLERGNGSLPQYKRATMPSPLNVSAYGRFDAVLDIHCNGRMSVLRAEKLRLTDQEYPWWGGDENDLAAVPVANDPASDALHSIMMPLRYAVDKIMAVPASATSISNLWTRRR